MKMHINQTIKNVIQKYLFYRKNIEKGDEKQKITKWRTKSNYIKNYELNTPVNRQRLLDEILKSKIQTL